MICQISQIDKSISSHRNIQSLSPVSVLMHVNELDTEMCDLLMVSELPCKLWRF